MVVSRLLEENKKKSKISVNCFLAIGAYVGYKMVIQDQENDYGVDVLLWNQIERNGHIRDLSTVLQFQLKSTQNYRIEKDEIVYHIENKTFNDIAQRNIIQSTPLIVVILILPQESEIDWISINENDIRFRRSLYWYHNDLTEIKKNENSKTIIRIPLGNQLTPESLIELINNFAVRKI